MLVMCWLWSSGIVESAESIYFAALSQAQNTCKKHSNKQRCLYPRCNNKFAWKCNRVQTTYVHMKCQQENMGLQTIIPAECTYANENMCVIDGWWPDQPNVQWPYTIEKMVTSQERESYAEFLRNSFISKCTTYYSKFARKACMPYHHQNYWFTYTRYYTKSARKSLVPAQLKHNK